MYFFYASIKWIEYQSGGRKSPPPEGTRYCPLIRINETLGNTDWSIEFTCPRIEEQMVIKFNFISEKAPMSLLIKNKKYELFEGNKRVAEIKII